MCLSTILKAHQVVFLMVHTQDISICSDNYSVQEKDPL